MVEALLRGAARVLVRRGYAGASTNHIAEAAGASVGSLYEYFANKEAIFERLAEAHIDAAEALLSARFAALSACGERPSLRAILDALVGAMIELHAEEPELHHRLATEVPLTAKVRARVEALEARAVEGLSLLLTDHPEVRAPVALAAPLVVEAADALTHRWFAQGALARDPEVAARELRLLFLGYLGGAGR